MLLPHHLLLLLLQTCSCTQSRLFSRDLPLTPLLRWITLDPTADIFFNPSQWVSQLIPKDLESDYQTSSFQCKEIELFLGEGKPHSVKTDESNNFQRGGEGGHSLIKTLYSKLFFNLKLLKPQCLAINPQYFLSPKIQGGGGWLQLFRKFISLRDFLLPQSFF